MWQTYPTRLLLILASVQMEDVVLPFKSVFRDFDLICFRVINLGYLMFLSEIGAIFKRIITYLEILLMEYIFLFVIARTRFLCTLKPNLRPVLTRCHAIMTVMTLLLS